MARRALLVVKGAPEEILGLSTHYEAGDVGVGRNWDAAAREKAKRQLDGLGNQGLRVLGIASKQVGKDHDHAARKRRKPSWCLPALRRFSIRPRPAPRRLSQR